MSEIKRLIEKLCPEGVEYKKLGEVCVMQVTPDIEDEIEKVDRGETVSMS